MDWSSHLFLHERRLAAGEEWQVAAPGWWFIRLSSGGAYWLGKANQVLDAGDVIVIAPSDNGLVRSSQVGNVSLHHFLFMPDLLTGFFTLSEQTYFHALAAEPKPRARHFSPDHAVAKDFAALAASPHEQSELAQRCQMLHIVTRVLGEEIDRARAKPRSRPTARERFVQLVNEMPAAELINRPHEDWARLCRCSVRHFDRLFRDFFGISLNQKQAELRLAKASQTLYQFGEGALGTTVQSSDATQNSADEGQRTTHQTETDQPV